MNNLDILLAKKQEEVKQLQNQMDVFRRNNRMTRLKDVWFEVASNQLVGRCNISPVVRHKIDENVYLTIIHGGVKNEIRISFGGLDTLTTMKKFITKHNLNISFEGAQRQIISLISQADKLMKTIKVLGEDDERTS